MTKRLRSLKRADQRFKSIGRKSVGDSAFPVDAAAFVDKLVLSVYAELSEAYDDVLLDAKSQGILHPGVLYSRKLEGTSWVTRNRVVVLYGRTKKFQNVPPLRITMHSGRTPLTAAEALLFAKKVTLHTPAIRISSLEFTFDVTNTTIAYVLRHLIHRAQGDPRVWSDGKRHTIYVGSPHSAWQVRIYQKTDSVVRIEFILRRAFLSRWQINEPEDLLLLRKLNVWDLVSVRRFSASSAARVTSGWKDAVDQELIRTWAEYQRPLQRLPKILKNHGVRPWRVLRRTRLQKKLEIMQTNFVW